AAGMLDPLHHEERLLGPRGQRAVAIVAGVGRKHRAAERPRPEIGGGRDVVGAAIDDERAKTALVHGKVIRSSTFDARPPLLPLLALAAACAAAGRPVTLSVVGTSDLHGHVEALPVLGGYLANLRRARAADGGGVVLVDAGDMMQGTLESGL